MKVFIILGYKIHIIYIISDISRTGFLQPLPKRGEIRHGESICKKEL